MDIRNFIGETFCGGATIEILDMGGFWRVVVEQIEPDDNTSDTHMFCFDSDDKKEASFVLEHIVSTQSIHEENLDTLGFYYL